MKDNNLVGSNTDRVLTLIIQCSLFLYLAYALSGCSAKFEFGYHGKTGRDDLTSSEEISTSNTKSRRY